jgi:hypothetical protein
VKYGDRDAERNSAGDQQPMLPKDSTSNLVQFHRSTPTLMPQCAAQIRLSVATIPFPVNGPKDLFSQRFG